MAAKPTAPPLKAESTDGFQRCQDEWNRVHVACPTSVDPDAREIECMRFGYEMGRKDGRAHRK